MSWLANTTVTILRGSQVDEYGDEVDDDTAVATGVRASLLERTVTDLDRETGGTRQLRRVTGRVGTQVDIREGDRIKDERTDEIYAVNTLTRPTGFTHVSSIRLDLDRTT